MGIQQQCKPTLPASPHLPPAPRTLRRRVSRLWAAPCGGSTPPSPPHRRALMMPPMVLVLLLLLGLGLRLAAAQEEEQLCVLPIGDSITDGMGRDSWRPELWRRLLDAGTDVLYVGSQIDESQPEHAGRPFPRHHEGHPGWTSAQILGSSYHNMGDRGSLDVWLETYDDLCTPTCMLVHLGTNDICTSCPPEFCDVVSNIREIISRVAARFDGAPLTALVASPIPSCCSDVGDVLAPAIQAAFAADSNFGLEPGVANVSMVDMTTGYEELWNYDGCHPDGSGEDFMAARWFEAIRQHCRGPPAAGDDPCSESDVNGDRSVDVNDLLLVLSAYGQVGAGGEDLTGDGLVSVEDLLRLLASYGCAHESG